MFTERRSCLRHKVHGPIFASFDGVTGGMILDLSEQGLSMQTVVPMQGDRRLHLRLELPESDPNLETTGYVAWADALGRAGVRFSELPTEARQRLNEWLTLNDTAPSRKAPKLAFDRIYAPDFGRPPDGESFKPRSISLEAEIGSSEGESGSWEAEGRGSDLRTATISVHGPEISSSIQYEFNSLGPDLNVALHVIAERARALLRGTGAAIAIIKGGHMLCYASVGAGGPPLGTCVDANSGLSGECIRTGKTLICDDAENDSRTESAICRNLGIRSMVAAPIRYERDVVGLLEVFSTRPCAFEESDLAVLARLAQTILLTLSQR